MNRSHLLRILVVGLALAACIPDVGGSSGAYPPLKTSEASLAPSTQVAYPPPRGTPAVDPTPKPAKLSQEFVLKVGQTVLISEANLTVRFRAVTEDSRCPKKTTCAQAGQARITVGATVKNTSSPLLELSTNPALKQDRVTFSGYEIQLKALNPYPDDPNKKINESDYEAAFVVAKQ